MSVETLTPIWSADVVGVELAVSLLVVLGLQDMPKMLDWCLLHRRDAVSSDLGGGVSGLCVGGWGGVCGR